MKIFHKLAKLTSWVILSKRGRIAYKDYCEFLDLAKEINTTKNNYKKIIERIKNRASGSKIKVAFLIRENQKWAYQSLYEEFEKSEVFEPLVLVSPLVLTHIGKDMTRDNLEDNYNFFKSRNMNVNYAYKNRQYVDLKEFNPDIVFYDQPWDLPELHSPMYVSEFALTCYCPYAYELTDTREHYLTSFHRFLYRFFVISDIHMNIYESYMKGNSENCTIAGYPKLDEYFSKTKSNGIWKNNEKIKILYAPHHSFEKNGLHLATFRENGEFMLSFAKQHPETEWIFKPHPRFKYALLKNKIMNESEIEDYYNEWNKIGSVYDKGDYIDTFRTSDLLITDCVSFIAEYLPTKHPIIWLSNSSSAMFNEIGESIKKSCYLVNSETELENTFDELVNRKEDNKKSQRLAITQNIICSEPSAKKVYDFLLQEIEIVNE